MSPRFLWSEAVGPAGARAVAIERTPGRFYVGHYVQGSTGLRLKRVAATTRKQALAAALAFSQALVLTTAPERTGTTTVGALLARYTADVSAHKKGQQPKEDARRAALWLAFLGADREARTVTKTDLKRFERARRAGTITAKVWRTVTGPDGARTRQLVPLKLKPKPSENTIGADIIYLQAVWNWAVEEELPGMDRSRIARYAERPATAQPKRPLVTYDRYLAVRETADQAHPRFGAFLDLVEGLGWRVSAVCRLKASHIDRTVTEQAPFGRIFKDPATDKEEAGGWVPMPESVRKAVDAIPVVGDAWLFPSPRDPRKPWSRWYARERLERAESLAGLAPVEGGDWHPYRRKWATERKHLPTPDVMAAGAWKDRRSLETAYQQTDPETMKRVALETTKLRDVQAATKHGGAR